MILTNTSLPNDSFILFQANLPENDEMKIPFLSQSDREKPSRSNTCFSVFSEFSTSLQQKTNNLFNSLQAYLPETVGFISSSPLFIDLELTGLMLHPVISDKPPQKLASTNTAQMIKKEKEFDIEKIDHPILKKNDGEEDDFRSQLERDIDGKGMLVELNGKKIDSFEFLIEQVDSKKLSPKTRREILSLSNQKSMVIAENIISQDETDNLSKKAKKDYIQAKPADATTAPKDTLKCSIKQNQSTIEFASIVILAEILENGQIKPNALKIPYTCTITIPHDSTEELSETTMKLSYSYDFPLR